MYLTSYVLSSWRLFLTISLPENKPSLTWAIRAPWYIHLLEHLSLWTMTLSLYFFVLDKIVCSLKIGIYQGILELTTMPVRYSYHLLMFWSKSNAFYSPSEKRQPFFTEESQIIYVDNPTSYFMYGLDCYSLLKGST